MFINGFHLNIRQLDNVQYGQERRQKNWTLLSRLMEGSHVTDYKEIVGPSFDFAPRKAVTLTLQPPFKTCKWV